MLSGIVKPGTEYTIFLLLLDFSFILSSFSSAPARKMFFTSLAICLRLSDISQLWPPQWIFCFANCTKARNSDLFHATSINASVQVFLSQSRLFTTVGIQYTAKSKIEQLSMTIIYWIKRTFVVDTIRYASGVVRYSKKSLYLSLWVLGLTVKMLVMNFSNLVKFTAKFLHHLHTYASDISRCTNET